MLLFWVNSVLKSLVSAFTPVRNPGEGIGAIGLSSPPFFLDQTEAQKAEKNFLGTLNLKKLARLFQVSNPCLSLPSVATEDRKQFQCLLEFN